MNSPNLSQPTRQSLKGLIFIFLQSIRAAVRMFWALILVFVVQKNLLQYKGIVAFVLLALLILLIIHSVLYYLNFYFYVKDGEFVLKRGYLRKKVLSIPLERIQSVNTKQNLVQQLLEVVALEIDTAGTAGKELKIHALEKSYANALYELLSSKKTGHFTADNSNEKTIQTAAEKLILKLSPVDLLKIGISQNHLRTAFIIIAFGMQLFNQIEDVFEQQADQYSSEFTTYLSHSSLALIIFLVLFFLIVSVFISLFRTLFKYFDFKLTKKENAYRVEAGLANKRNVVMPFKKIQEINWETGPIKKRFGIYNLVFKQAISGKNKKMQVVDVPGCLDKHLKQLQSDLFGEDQLSSQIKIYTDNYYFRRLWLFFGWLPALLPAVFLFAEWIYWVGALAWLVLTAGYCLLVLRKRYFQVNNEQIRVSKGAILHKWKQMELFKIQSVEFRQTIFQQRRGLASLTLTNASGTLSIPFLNESMAKQIYDYLLYHTEISEKSWM